MAVNTNFQIPFNPGEGIAGQMLQAIQMANEHFVQQRQLALQQAQLQQGQQRLGIEQQQANTAQAGEQSEAGLRQAQIPGLQAEPALKQAQTAAETARAQHETIQSQIEQTAAGPQRELLAAQGREANSRASLLEAQVAMMQNMGKPGGFSSAIDQAIDKTKYPELNQRTKAMATMATSPEELTRVIAQGAEEASTLGRETDPRVQQARIMGAVGIQAALNGVGGNGPAIKDLPAAKEQFAKAGTDAANTLSQIKNVRDTIAAAKTGDQVASAFAPVASVLGSNAFQGTHRFSPTELETIQGLGSVGRQINTWLDKHATGTLPPDSIKEFQGMVDRLGDATRSAYADRTKVINGTYKTNFTPLDLGGSSTSAAAPAQASSKGGWFGQFGGVAH